MISLPSFALSHVHHARAGLPESVAAISLLLPHGQTYPTTSPTCPNDSPLQAAFDLSHIQSAKATALPAVWRMHQKT